MNAETVFRIVVPPELAEELKGKDVTELMLRGMKARFKALKKVKILGEDNTAQQAAESLKDMARDQREMRRELHQFQAQMKDGFSRITPSLKNLSVRADDLFRMTKSIQSISYLNVGLGLLNLGVNVAGFAIVCAKLNKLSAQMGEISKVAAGQKNEKKADCTNLIMRINLVKDEIVDAEKSGTIPDLKEMQKLLMDIRSFLSEMISNLYDEVFKVPDLLDMIFTLLAGYTAVLCEFLRDSYYTRHSLPANYEQFRSLYDELERPGFRRKVWDYYAIIAAPIAPA